MESQDRFKGVYRKSKDVMILIPNIMTNAFPKCPCSCMVHTWGVK